MADTEQTESISGKMQVVVVTPEKTVLDTGADFVALPLFDGEIGIAPYHSPMIGRLGYGELRIRLADGTESTYYVDGGFVQIADNVISVLTNRALPSLQVEADKAEAQMAEAMKRPISTEEELAVRDRLVTQGRAQKQVAKRAKK